MKDRFAVSIAIAVIVAFGIASGAVATPSPAPEAPDSPGERVAGVIEAHQAEHESEVDERAFGISVAMAETDEAQAEVVAERLARNTERLEAIETRLTELTAMRDAGELSDGEFEARVTRLEIERQSVERTTDESAQVAEGLPAVLLEEQGINTTALETLRERAHRLGGQEVREIARSIAGEDVGATDRPSVATRLADEAIDRLERADRPEDAIAQASRWVDRADRVVEKAHLRVERVGPDEEAAVQLAKADDHLDVAKAALASAHAELEAGKHTAALDDARAAIEHASAAVDAANEALDAVRGVGDVRSLDPPSEVEDAADPHNETADRTGE